LLADKGYDANWYRQALREIGIAPCIPFRKNRKAQIEYDKNLYKQRHKIENAFGKLKDWRAIALRYHRHAYTFLAVITIAAIVNFWL
jgi:transposase